MKRDDFLMIMSLFSIVLLSLDVTDEFMGPKVTGVKRRGNRYPRYLAARDAGARPATIGARIVLLGSVADMAFSAILSANGLWNLRR